MDKVEVTDADREAAARIAVLTEMRELILAGRADHHAEPFAHHRQAAMIEGARIMQREAVADVLEWYPGGSIDRPGYAAAKALVASLQSLSPEAIIRQSSALDALAEGDAVLLDYIAP